MPGGIVIAAPSSGSGKTTVTLGLLRCLRRSGVRVSSFKAGPDYIDPAFHAAAAGRACLNLDGWAMRPETLIALLREAAEDAGIVIGEGVMGLFDGPSGGSTADLAAALDLPVLLVVDAGAQAQSAAAVVHGFATWRTDVRVAGVVFNRVGGDRHAAMLRAAMESLDVPVLGCLPRTAGVALPSRHLGLVQASEMPTLETFIEAAADLVDACLDLEAFRALLAAVGSLPGGTPPPPLPPLGQRVAVARDDAFRFSYPHVLDGWRRAGAEIVPFSPLADERPDAAADAVYLPGGYPELHAGPLAANGAFLDGVRRAGTRGAVVYGECGGYMVLGETLTDADGAAHRMAGLLPLETSMAERSLHLGYRRAELTAAGPLGPEGETFGAHEFHYAAILQEDGADSLFRVRDAAGAPLGRSGLRRDNVMGSFVHLIDARPFDIDKGAAHKRRGRQDE